jgi:hypothetical protein
LEGNVRGGKSHQSSCSEHNDLKHGPQTRPFFQLNDQKNKTATTPFVARAGKLSNRTLRLVLNRQRGRRRVPAPSSAIFLANFPFLTVACGEQRDAGNSSSFNEHLLCVDLANQPDDKHQQDSSCNASSKTTKKKTI